VGMETGHVAVGVPKGENRGKIYCANFVEREREGPLRLSKGLTVERINHWEGDERLVTTL